MKLPVPSQAELQQLLDYDPATGELRWKARELRWFSENGCGGRLGVQARWNAKHAGKRAFYIIDGNGYPSGGFFGVTRRAHRIIWKWMTGREARVIDHINGDRADNRWCNLREVDYFGNSANQGMSSRNTSGATGVWLTPSKTWAAEIKCRGVKRHLGRFSTFEDAVSARKKAERELGFHPNHGRLCERYGEVAR